MKKSLLLFLMSLYSPLFLFAEVGDTFTAKTTEGYDMVFTILDETEMTCQVGYLDGASNKLAVDKDVINGTVTIPNIVTPLGSDDGYIVNKIGKYAFYGCSNITSIIIPDAVEAIDDYALAECINLGLVIIEVEGPIDITAEVFANSDRFNAALHVPVACKEDYAAAPIWKEFGMILEGNEGSTFTAKTAEDVEMVFTILDEIEMTCQVGYLDGASNKPAVNRDVVEGAVTIPGSVNGYTVVKIGKYAFDNTVKMTSVTIPTTVTSINNNAFFNCNGLTSFELPASVTNIGKSALVSLRSVTSLKVAEGNTVYDSRGDCNAIIETATNKLLFGSKITTIPADVSEIGEYSFAYLDNYTFTIPSTVTKIDDNAFSFCANWTLQVEHTTPLEISENVFGDMNNTTTLRVPSGSKDAYAAATGWKNFGIIEEPATLTAKSYSRAYGEDNPTFDYDATGGTITGTPEITCEATTTSDVGTYDIIISKGTITNNDVTYVNGTLTITSKTVSSPTITLSETSYTYDESAKEPTVTVKDGETTISSDEYTVSYSNNTNVGTATVTITDKEGGNYIVSGSTTFAISAADGSLTAPTGNTGLVYTGDAQDLITAGSTTTGTLQYSLDGTNYGTTIPQGTDANEYTVYYRVEGDDNHNDVAATSFKVTIAKAPLKITAKNYTRKQGEANPEFGVTYEGFKNNETDAVLTTKPTITCAATESSEAGTYDIVVSGASAANYEISYVAGTLTVEAITPPTPMPEPKGTIFDVNLDESASKEVNITFVVKEMDHSGTPTVAISDDKDASGSVSIPEAVTHNGVEYKVTEISEGAFQNNTSLTEVKIPASITSIGAKAFAGCKNLQEITINIIVPINIAVISARGLTRTESSSSVFEGVDMETCILYVPEGSVDAYKAAPGWKDFKNIVVIGTATGIKGTEMAEGETFDVFNLNGLKVKSQATSLDGLPRGIYIINGKKVMK